jgi:hypothetical protein
LSDSDDKPKVSSIKPLVDAKSKPAVSLVSLVSLEDDFSATREPVTTHEEEAVGQQTKRRAPTAMMMMTTAHSSAAASRTLKSRRFAANDDDDEADDFFVVGMSFDESENMVKQTARLV